LLPSARCLEAHLVLVPRAENGDQECLAFTEYQVGTGLRHACPPPEHTPPLVDSVIHDVVESEPAEPLPVISSGVVTAQATSALCSTGQADVGGSEVIEEDVEPLCSTEITDPQCALTYLTLFAQGTSIASRSASVTGVWIVAASEEHEKEGRRRFWRIGPSRGRSTWAARVRHEVDRLRADVTTASIEGPDLPDTQRTIGQHRIDRIRKHLDDADEVLEQHFQQRWPRQLIGASGAYQEALASVYRAGEDLILVQSDAALAARLPGLRAAVQSYLSSEDPRRELYLLRIDAALTTTGAERLAAAARDSAGSTSQPPPEAPGKGSDSPANPGS
jgi:hypothetical protein